MKTRLYDIWGSAGEIRIAIGLTKREVIEWARIGDFGGRSFTGACQSLAKEYSFVVVSGDPCPTHETWSVPR